MHDVAELESGLGTVQASLGRLVGQIFSILHFQVGRHKLKRKLAIYPVQELLPQIEPDLVADLRSLADF